MEQGSEKEAKTWSSWNAAFIALDQTLVNAEITWTKSSEQVQASKCIS